MKIKLSLGVSSLAFLSLALLSVHNAAEAKSTGTFDSLGPGSYCMTAKGCTCPKDPKVNGAVKQIKQNQVCINETGPGKPVPNK